MRSRQKEKNEFYETPVLAARLAGALMDPSLNYWEPCAGRRAIANQFDNITECSDIEIMVDGVSKRDALTCSKPDNIQAIITNPPFTLGDEITRRALFEWEIPALMLMRVEYISGKNRMDIRKHLTDLHIVSDLIRFETLDGRIMNGNGTGRCAWMLFDPKKIPKQVRTKFVLFDN